MTGVQTCALPISIELPENVRAQVFNPFEKLKNSKICYGNFVKKENLHLVLKFLGNFRL